jgi:hypothetical protein
MVYTLSRCSLRKLPGVCGLCEPPWFSSRPVAGLNKFILDLSVYIAANKQLLCSITLFLPPQCRALRDLMRPTAPEVTKVAALPFEMFVVTHSYPSNHLAASWFSSACISKPAEPPEKIIRPWATTAQACR